MSATYPASQGAWEAKRLVNDYLQWDMPRRVLTFRTEWDLDDTHLPMPEHYVTHEPPALDHWPTIVTICTGLSRAERIDYMGGMNAVYRCTYGMRTYVWARGESAEEAVETRDRLTAVVRSSLLDHACFRVGANVRSDQTLLDEGTLREEYSDVTYVKGSRAVAGSFVSYNMSLDEAILRTNIAELEEITVEYASGGAPLDSLDENVFTQVIP